MHPSQDTHRGGSAPRSREGRARGRHGGGHALPQATATATATVTAWQALEVPKVNMDTYNLFKNTVFHASVQGRRTANRCAPKLSRKRRSEQRRTMYPSGLAAATPLVSDA